LRLASQHYFRGFGRGLGGGAAHLRRRLGFRHADFFLGRFGPALKKCGHARSRLAGDTFGFRVRLRDENSVASDAA
jgi:hypothetical protein